MPGIKIKFRPAWELLKQVYFDFNQDKILSLAGALAYGTVFALPGLLIIVIWVSGLFYDPAVLRSKLFMELTQLMGKESVDKLLEVMLNTKFDTHSYWAKALGIITLVLGSTSIFGEIQSSINTIWGLKTKPRTGLLKILLNRLLSFSLVISLGFILIVSLIVNAVTATLMSRIEQRFSQTPVVLFYIANQLILALILFLLFGIIFKVLPDAKIKWKNVFLSSAITTILFLAGKFVIGYILGRNATITAYGSAGSVIIILLWVYYSSIILYLGAEFTQAFLKLKGKHIAPNKYAVWIEKKEIAVKSNTEADKNESGN